MENKDVREAVRQHYAKAAKLESSCCSPQTCGCSESELAENMARDLGYSADELSQVPEGANLGLGCGNPTAIAELKEGEVVLDLGSGAGFDAFLSARQVGETGRVIGVDMTDEMLEKARANAEKSGYTNVEFIKGHIEDLPLPDNSVDVIISNCVINLSPEKSKVYREAFRVLKSGGRVEVSDVVAFGELPPELKENLQVISACVGGAISKAKTETIMKEAGFVEIQVIHNEETRKTIKKWGLSSDIANSITSAHIKGKKP